MFKVFKIGVKKTGKQIDLLIGKFFNKYAALYITIVGWLLPFNSNNSPLTGNAVEQYNLKTKNLILILLAPLGLYIVLFIFMFFCYLNYKWLVI